MYVGVRAKTPRSLPHSDGSAHPYGGIISQGSFPSRPTFRLAASMRHERTVADRRRATRDRRQTTDDRRQATGDKRQAACAGGNDADLTIELGSHKRPCGRLPLTGLRSPGLGESLIRRDLIRHGNYRWCAVPFQQSDRRIEHGKPENCYTSYVHSGLNSTKRLGNQGKTNIARVRVVGVSVIFWVVYPLRIFAHHFGVLSALADGGHSPSQCHVLSRRSARLPLETSRPQTFTKTIYEAEELNPWHYRRLPTRDLLQFVSNMADSLAGFFGAWEMQVIALGTSRQPARYPYAALLTPRQQSNLGAKD